MRRPSAPAVLLDTCALIWLVNDDKMIEASIEAILFAGEHQGILVSPVSAWEVGLACRPRNGRPAGLQLQLEPKTWFAKILATPGVKAAPFTPDIAIDASFLPGDLHNDPADRMLIATARHLAVPIVTRDRALISYGDAGYVSVIPC